MNNLHLCKGCTGSVSVETQPALFLNDEVLLGEKELLEKKRRLNLCFRCEFLQYGTTCGQSGMLVSYRTGLINTTCPHPKKSKW